MANEIVPFGRYRGKPVEALAQDKEYCEWLLTKDWFPGKYPSIHTLIINNFGEPAETPEHNALQALFLDENWVKAFIVTAVGGAAVVAQGFPDHMKRWATGLLQSIKEYQRDKRITGQDRHEWIDREISRLMVELDGLPARQWQTELRVSQLEFEQHGRDVTFGASVDFNGNWERVPWMVECKPSMADDYPAVLRQMTAGKGKFYASMRNPDGNVLLLGAGGYSGVGATFDQVKKIFAMSGIKIVCLSEVDVNCIEATQ